MTLLDLVQQDTALKLRNREWWGCCPFHAEKTPSFSVNEEKSLYFCFGCGAKGDAITYARVKRGLSFRDAAALVGKELPESDRARQTRERTVKDCLLWDYYTWFHCTRNMYVSRFRELNAELQVAAIGYHATLRCPDLYTEAEKNFWEHRIADLYNATVEGSEIVDQLDILTYDRHLPERFAWWEQEQHD